MYLLEWTGWPPWSLACFAAELVFLVLLKFSMYISDTSIQSSKKMDRTCTVEEHKRFRAFQNSYLTVYLLLMLADWLQGTTMYTLYQSYGVDIGALFLTGFLSAAVFGTFVGALADQFGRQKGCILYCILEIIINCLEHSTNFTVLMVGRILGGISTSLLFSVFESWMITEHRKRGFPEHLLASTFSLATEGNGIMAILAGILAQVAKDYWGHIGPFKLAVGLTALALVCIVWWPENYGEGRKKKKSTGKQENKLATAMHNIVAKPEIPLLGLSVSFFEGAMYTFVFMWVPTVLSLAPEGSQGDDFPIGVVFACLMASITVGGMLFELMVSKRQVPAELFSIGVYVIGAISLVVPVVLEAGFAATLVGFLVFEACVGSYFPSSGILRSRYFPEDVMSTVINIFRVPLNILVVVGTRLGDLLPPKQVFLVCTVWLLLAAGLQVLLARRGVGRRPSP